MLVVSCQAPTQRNGFRQIRPENLKLTFRLISVVYLVETRQRKTVPVRETICAIFALLSIAREMKHACS